MDGSEQTIGRIFFTDFFWDLDRKGKGKGFEVYISTLGNTMKYHVVV